MAFIDSCRVSCSFGEWSWGMVLGNDFRVETADGAGWAAEGMELGNGFRE
jgi:hypothetical protein